MLIKDAMTVLERRAKFYNKPVAWLIDAMDQGMEENIRTEKAYTVYKALELVV